MLKKLVVLAATTTICLIPLIVYSNEDKQPTLILSNVTNVVFSPNTRKIVYLTFDSIMIFDRNTSVFSKKELISGVCEGWMVFSLNGKKIYYYLEYREAGKESYSGIWMVPLDKRTKPEKICPVRPNQWAVNVSFVNNQKIIYSTGYEIVALNLSEKKEEVLKDTGGYYHHFFGLSPDKKKIGYLDNYEFEGQTTLRIMDLDGSNDRLLTTFNQNPNENDSSKELAYDDGVWGADWLSDKKIVYTAGYRFGTIVEGGSLYVKDIETGKRISLGADNVNVFKTSPDETKIVYSQYFYDEYDNIIKRELWIMDTNGQNKKRLWVIERGFITRIFWPKGKEIFFILLGHDGYNLFSIKMD
ncbi:MAG: hypothetical protein AB1630_02000 [bacterium]